MRLGRGCEHGSSDAITAVAFLTCARSSYRSNSDLIYMGCKHCVIPERQLEESTDRFGGTEASAPSGRLAMTFPFLSRISGICHHALHMFVCRL